MQDIIKNKSTLTFALLVLAALFLYNSFAGGISPEEASSTPQISTDLVKISENLSAATLSRDIFSSPGYRLLSDFSTPLVQEPTGRTNPFAPVGQ